MNRSCCGSSSGHISDESYSEPTSPVAPLPIHDADGESVWTMIVRIFKIPKKQMRKPWPGLTTRMQAVAIGMLLKNQERCTGKSRKRPMKEKLQYKGWAISRA